MRKAWLAGATAAVVAAVVVGAWAAEKRVKLDELPAAVKATILKEAGTSRVDEVNEVTCDKQVTYEAEFKAGGKEVEVKVAPDGRLLKREAEADDDKD